MVFIDNLNGRGVSVKKVVSGASMKGIDKDVVLDSIEHLKIRGEAYEPKNGEIKMCLDNG